MAPESYWKLSEEEKYEIVNGCGPERATGFLPNSILGVDLRAACNIHDYTYARPDSMIDRKDADDVFFRNMKGAVNQNVKSPILHFFALYGIMIYYFAVRLFGRSYYGR